MLVYVLAKLVNQLARRIPNLELDADVVRVQVQGFKAMESSILKSAVATGGKKPTADVAEETAVAKLVEEMKSLPSRVAERLAEEGSPFRRRRMMRMFHPHMLDQLIDMSGDPGDPVGILMVASVMRDDAPWLYELAMEVYRAVKSGDVEGIEREMTRLRRFSEMMMEGPFFRDFGDKEMHMFTMELPRMLEYTLRRTLERRNAIPAKKSPPPPPRRHFTKPHREPE
ncbi:MAG: hypothetical protein ABSB42_19090 [Tepidisphaeraceae bacterium]